MSAVVTKLSENLFSFTVTTDGVHRTGNIVYADDTITITYKDGKPATDVADIAVSNAFLQVLDRAEA